MCSQAVQVEAGMIYRSHIQILILTQRVKVTHTKLVYTHLIKQQIQLFCYSVFLSQLQAQIR